MPDGPFHFPRRERLGMIVWTLLALLIWWLPQWFPEPELDYEFFPATEDADSTATAAALYAEPTEEKLRPFDPNTVTQAELIAFGLPERAARGWVNYRKAAGDYADLAALQRVRAIPASELDRLAPYLRFSPSERPDSPTAMETPPSQTPPDNPVAYFDFDPNLVTEAELRRLGLTEREAASLLRYRAAGARFNRAEDWLRIRSVPAEKLRDLLPYLELPAAVAEASATSSRPVAYDSPPRELGPIDINRATVADWQRLPGVGEYWSGRILAFRRALGGFVSVAQVAETRGLPDSVFRRIEPYLQPGELLGRIPVNSATEEELARHPYLSRRQATVLVAFRTQRGRLTAEDFTNFKALSAADRARILPYLSF